MGLLVRAVSGIRYGELAFSNHKISWIRILFVEVLLREKGFKTKLGEGFDRCKEIIIEEAANGWRLKQVVIPANEKTGIPSPYCYQIIFEKSTLE